MKSEPTRRLTGIRACFALTCGLGLCLIMFGLGVEPLGPVFQLDVVLTPEQLQDERVREETSAMLQKLWESNNEAYVWATLGAAVVVISAVGLRLSSAKLPQ